MTAPFIRPLGHALGAMLLLSTALPASVLAAEQEDQKSEAARRAEENTARPPIEEQAQPSKGHVTVEGQRIDYTATPGTLTLRNDAGEPIASMFYVAYTADNRGEASDRPVTFIFNGGPGSSSMWLHMGSFGPVRVDTPTDRAQPPAPFSLGPNHESLIDTTDLVFLDAIGTGLSRPLGKAEGPEFWGVDQDIDAFAKGIQRYLSITRRWNSPKILLGESYGTLRAAGLVNELQNRGVQMNGVILLSSILNYGIRNPGYDRLYVTYLPSYAATAWYHNRLADRPARLEPFLDEVREFARGPYLAALAKGDDLSDAERNRIASRMAAYTGLSPEFLLRNDLRVDLNRFRKELMRDQSRTVGRLDSRFTGIDVDEAGDGPQYDPADTAISGAYTAAINSYLFGTLGYKTELQYRPNFYREISSRWDQSHTPPDGGWGRMTAANTALDLARAMRINPHLQVLSLNGYYDMATPFFGAEYDLKHMQLDPSLRGNLTFRYYKSGHMIYIRPEAMTALRRDLVDFYKKAAP
ncbi:peptidase S10 [Altericroceibacterium spongiae]|uniref:Peptidase S10 n=1 Tax=Altericroceibacterium spongiae TaxID=2320269 RepID=A0A420ERJ9_9SPHN|nr:peptidase S10 [Altericroceibacterium spongiae]RKF23326.1 peptidase S10 [Altericroceibacterium spongiae]